MARAAPALAAKPRGAHPHARFASLTHYFKRHRLGLRFTRYSANRYTATISSADRTARGVVVVAPSVCATDAQCNTGGNRGGGGNPGMFCAPSLGICVECVANSQCGDQGYCQPDHACGGGA